MNKPSIIIIGSGATGLIAAKELSPYFKVTVLEANPITGGRIQSIRDWGIIMEAGAEFVHGNLPLTLGLLNEAGIACVKTSGRMYRHQNGLFTNAAEMTAAWDVMLDQINGLTEDITLFEFLETYFPGPANEVFCRQVKSYAEGFDLADIARVSVKALYREWIGESYDNYRIPAGYSSLTNYLQQQAEQDGAVFYTGTTAREVHWQPGAVIVLTAGGKRFSAEKLLVTVPVSLLQQPGSKATIRFTPGIQLYEHAAAGIGFGAVIKVVLQFKNAFWQPDAGFILSEQLIPTWWTQLPDKKPVLTGWLGGPAAAAISGDTDEKIIEKALASLAEIYARTVVSIKNDLENARVFNWQKNETALGAYSYATIQSEAAKELLSTPLSVTIFFAGEALYTGDHPGTVEAALVNGIDTANKIKAPLGLPVY